MTIVMVYSGLSELYGRTKGPSQLGPESLLKKGRPGVDLPAETI